MQRVPEPELMDDPAQAEAYASADFSEPHDAFVAHFARLFPEFREGRVLDLGCGAADITIRFARAYPGTRLDGVDGAAAMLALGRNAVARARLEARVTLIEQRLPDTALAGAAYDAVICNSLLHHLADPRVLWQTVAAAARPGAPVLVMDLMRPASREAAQALVTLHAAGAPMLMQRDFLHSLCAAYRPEEIRMQLEASGPAGLTLEVVSDRHWIVWGRIRGSRAGSERQHEA
ncbi:MAG: class I SAM-dependent methyltransferase [Betaproteobacteria bacterium]|nr:class I SAM-dependent methyltransferase [Betaproteobacteria bacterium]